MSSTETQKTELKNIVEGFSRPGKIFTGLTNSAKSYLLANALRESNKPIIFIAQNHHEAQTYSREIKNLIADESKPVLNFACNEVSPYDQINSDLDIVHKQYEIFSIWQEKKSSLVVMPFKALQQLYISKERLETNKININKDTQIDPQELARDLVELGYLKEALVESRGQFSLRGDVMDIYPLHGEATRIEFFGDQIESLRSFSINSQRSIQKLESIEIQARYSIHRKSDDGLEEKIKTILEKYSKSLSSSGQDSINSLLSSDIENSAENLYWEGVEYYQALLDQDMVSLFEHMPDASQIVFDEWQDLLIGAERWQEQLLNQYQDNINSGKIIPLSFICEQAGIKDQSKQELHFPYQEIKANFDKFSHKTYLQTMPEEGQTATIDITSYPSPRFASKVEDFIEYIRAEIREEQQVIIFSEQPQRVLGILKEWDVIASYKNNIFEQEEIQLKEGDKIRYPVAILRDGVEEGFKLTEQKLSVLTDRELFGRSRQAIAKQKTKKETTRSDMYTNIAELKAGDYVVHYKHGIGRYQGTEFVELGAGSLRQEYLVIEYASEARVLIPVDQVNLLSRFNTNEDAKPKLSKLGGMEWERTKKKVKKSVKKIAHELINLYAARAKQTGYKYPPDTPWQIEMEDAFPYTETHDQLKAIEELKADMESEKLVDRLICGDAGFGKTEVIIRAIFKAVMEGKQVAILVPTTVLAQQHFNVFKDRYAPYPIRVGLLCRFKTAKEQKETVEKIKNNECDLVVGTHRLLQKDIQFHNLGLLVIDEEQRFGVAHKEKLKALRKDLDIISMSATPIPRTLHMSISGIKDISLIATAPVNRMPVKTYVGEYKASVIRTAILHELERGGQIFFVHNRIENIESIAMQIQELVPEASVRTAHGKMGERDLEDVMFSFVNHEFDILVCTTIIETGLDISNANTIIINDANTFGLSQLYQLRGRVGRSDVQAYAYLFYKPDAEISDTARQRLRAIRELTNLGAGYQVAMRDMEIRGVGNIFGSEQHGHMLAVGFDLYCQILSDTIEEMKGNIPPEDLETDTSIDIKVAAFFPENWLTDQRQRMNEYRRLSSIKNENTLEGLISEWNDRFGKLPEETKNLIEVVRLKLLAKAAKVASVNQEGNSIKISNELRLGKWLAVQKQLPSRLQNKINFKPGTLGSRNSFAYVSLDASNMDAEAILDAIKEIIRVIDKAQKS